MARKEPSHPPPIKPVEQQHVFGQKRAVAKIRAALASKPGEHLLVLGEPGTGRLELAIALAAEASRQPAADWIYVIEQHAPSRARAFALPAGEKARFMREVSEALDRAGAAFDRHIKGDEHRISLDLLEEEMRYHGEKAVEQIRRRAEAQNIAVVKSLDGYVLAPMHEGRVVRSDVFRALPEALKRNVEAKITTLEGELQSVVAMLPDVQFEACEKYDALIRQTALRAVRPGLGSIKKAYENDSSAIAALGAIEEAFLASATTSVAAGTFAPITILGREAVDAGDPTEPHRVVTAGRPSAADLVGEIGRDAAGRPTLLPGQLMRAGSGFVIVEAWKLAADPEGVAGARRRDAEQGDCTAKRTWHRHQGRSGAARGNHHSDRGLPVVVEARSDRSWHRATLPARREACRDGAGRGTQRRQNLRGALRGSRLIAG